MTERRCPNCDETVSDCSGAYSQGCWKTRCEKLEERLAQNDREVLGDVHLIADTDEGRLALLGATYKTYRTALMPSPSPTLPLGYFVRQENLGFLLHLAWAALRPVEIAALYCPICKTRHIDEGEFATKKHHTHACQGFVDDNGKRRRCGHVWRPALVPTVGVEALPGFINEEKEA
jgi:hypothetical protein